MSFDMESEYVPKKKVKKKSKYEGSEGTTW